MRFVNGKVNETGQDQTAPVGRGVDEKGSGLKTEMEGARPFQLHKQTFCRSDGRSDQQLRFYIVWEQTQLSIIRLSLKQTLHKFPLTLHHPGQLFKTIEAESFDYVQDTTLRHLFEKFAS